MSLRERHPFRLTTTIAGAGLLSTALLLGGCDSDGAGVEDAGSNDHVDTALSSSWEQAAPQPTRGSSADSARMPADQPDSEVKATGEAVASVGFGSYQVPLGKTSVLCDFAGDPAAEGYAWACEAPVHLGWKATKGGEANSVSYRPGANPEIFAILGNSGLAAGGALPSGTQSSIGGRYTVDTTSTEAVTITDITTGVAVRLTDGGYTRL